MNHEVLNDTMESAASIFLSLNTSGCQGLEVINSFGHIISEQTYDNATSFLIPNGHIKEHLVGDGEEIGLE